MGKFVSGRRGLSAARPTFSQIAARAGRLYPHLHSSLAARSHAPSLVSGNSDADFTKSVPEGQRAAFLLGFCVGPAGACLKQSSGGGSKMGRRASPAGAKCRGRRPLLSAGWRRQNGGRMVAEWSQNGRKMAPPLNVGPIERGAPISCACCVASAQPEAQPEAQPRAQVEAKAKDKKAPPPARDTLRPPDNWPTFHLGDKRRAKGATVAARTRAP